MEGWWKAEFLTALEAWSWCKELPRAFWPRPEMKPRDFGRGNGGHAPDLLVAPFDEKANGFEYESGPRVWIEIEERGTWWGNAAKGFGTANTGLRHDLAKWKDIGWKRQEDVVLACQIVSHTCPADPGEPPLAALVRQGYLGYDKPQYAPARLGEVPVF